jgi:hypothetical protein
MSRRHHDPRQAPRSARRRPRPSPPGLDWCQIGRHAVEFVCVDAGSDQLAALTGEIAQLPWQTRDNGIAARLVAANLAFGSAASAATSPFILSIWIASRDAGARHRLIEIARRFHDATLSFADLPPRHGRSLLIVAEGQAAAPENLHIAFELMVRRFVLVVADQPVPAALPSDDPRIVDLVLGDPGT